MSPLAMENWLPGLFAWMARATWQASVLAVLVLGVQWMLRRRLSAQVRCLLWAVVLLRLIAPPLPAGRWTLFPRQQPAAVISDKLATPAAPAPVAVAVPPTAHAATINPELVARLRTELASMPEVRDAESGIGALTGGLSLPAELPQVRAPAALAEASGSPAPTPTAPLQWTWRSILTIAPWIWLTGALFMGARLLLAMLRLNRTVRRYAPLDNPEFEALARRCAIDAGLRRAPRIFAADPLVGPAVTGLYSPRLLIPRDLPELFTAAELRLMLLHEFAHLRRRDLHLSWLMGILQALHWFNPILRQAFNRLRADCELACDEFALEHSSSTVADGDGDGERQVYGHALLRLAERVARFPAYPHSVMVGRIGMAEGSQHFHRRIVMIAQFNPSSRNILRRWPALMAAALLLCCGVLLADAADPAQGKPEAKPAPATGPFTPSIVSPPKPVAALTNSGGYTPVLIVPEVNNKAKSEALWLKLHASEIDLANKRGELDRLQTLRDTGAATDASVQRAQAELAQAVATVASVKAQYDQSKQAGLEDLDRRLTIVARKSGTAPNSPALSPADSKIRQARVHVAEVDLANKQADLNRVRALFNTGVVSKEELQKLEGQVALAEANVALEQAIAAGGEQPYVPAAGMSRPDAVVVQPLLIDPAMKDWKINSGRPGVPQAFGNLRGGGALSNAAGGAVGSVTDVQDRESRAIDAAAAQKLRKPQTAAFDQVPLKEAIRHIADEANVDVLFDEKAIKETDADINAIVMLKIKQPTAGDQLLRWMLREQRSIGFTIDHGVMLVTSQQNINEMTTTRVYDVAPLAAGGPSLPELIREVVDAPSWREAGGLAGVIRMFGDKLLVTQTAANHAEIEKLLALLAAKGAGPAPEAGSRP